MEVKTSVWIWAFVTSRFIVLRSDWHWGPHGFGSHGSVKTILFPLRRSSYLIFWTCHILSQHRYVQANDFHIVFFHPLCFGWDWGQSYRAEFSKMNIHCLFHKNWHKALCLPCINKNVVESVSLVEFFLFQIFLKSFAFFSFSSQGCPWCFRFSVSVFYIL